MFFMTIQSLTCKVAGVVFLLIAVWGFSTGSHVLIFHVNTMHNLVHLLSGIAALWCGFAGPVAARRFCILFGATYGFVGLMGLLDVKVVNDLLNLNDADDILHLVIAAVFLAVGVATSPKRTPAPAG